LKPAEMLQALKRRIDEGGRLFVEVPHFDMGKWNWIYQFEMPHAWYFSGQSCVHWFRVVASESWPAKFRTTNA